MPIKFLFLFLGSFVWLNAPAFAQQSRIIHMEIKNAESALPSPGMPFKLVAQVYGNKKVQNPLRLVAVRDGNFHEFTSEKAYLNERDIATYEFVVPSPLADLKYHFIFQDEKGSISSEKYSIRRKCMPRISTELADIPDSIVGNERLKALYIHSSKLERQFSAYERAADLAEELNNLLKNP